MTIIKSISYSQDEILQNIVALHTGPIDCDVTFGSGCFYKNLPRPRLCFDLAPRRKGVITADVCHLPLKNGCIRAAVFDPPFLARTGPGATLKARFGELVGTIKDLWHFYFLAMREMHRVLAPGGWLVFKCQDGVLSGVNNMTHCVVWYQALGLGFIDKDLFVLEAATPRMMHPNHKVQKHARKYHCYFWVFQKRAKRRRR